MAREIKFRGFNRKNNVWLYGFYLQNRGAHFVCPDEFATGKSWDDYEIDPDTRGEFTGRKDKNGKEIYEGDVLMSQFSEKPFGVVTWHTDGYFFIDFSFGEWQYYGNGFVPLGEIMKRKIDGKSHQFEVIGNIHDNPELLK